MLVAVCLAAACSHTVERLPDRPASTAAAATSASDTLHVALPTGDREADRANAQAAFDAVRFGGTVQFAPGTYLLGAGARLTVPDVTPRIVWRSAWPYSPAHPNTICIISAASGANASGSHPRRTVPSGWPSTAYENFAPRFTDASRVLAVTRPGYGESEAHPEGFDVAAQAESLIDFLDALGIDRAVFAGNHRPPPS